MQFATLIKYLRLPLHSAPLILIGTFSFLLWIAQFGGLFAIPMVFILVSWFFKYSFVLLDHIVDGKHEPPVMSAEMVNPVEQRPFGLLLLIGGVYVATMGLESWWGEWPVRILRIALLCIVPAMVAVMSITGKFFQALNPIAVVGTIIRIPVAYGLLLISIAVLWFAPLASVKLLGLELPTLLLGALVMYLWLAMCSCIGGMVYEHRNELDYEAAHTPERTAAKADADAERQRDKIVDQIFPQVRSGAFANAGASARKLIEESAQPLDEFRWLYARAAQWPDQRFADYLVQLCLPRLLEARANGEALDVVRARLRTNSEFRPTSAAHLVRVVVLARNAGDRTTARTLLRDFDRHYPNDAAAAMAAKLSAELA